MSVSGKSENILLIRAGWDWRTSLGDCLQMTKPRITVMVVATAFVGFIMATGSFEAAGTMLMIAALTGTALSCMGASALNQVLERDTDGLMERTRDRPLPAGRMAVGPALALGLTLSFAGVGLLMVATTMLAASIAAFTIASYVLVYTPMKRLSQLSTIVGAVPGALPPVIGYAAATGSIGIEALLLFAIMFLWQLPHFLAIAWLYRDQYAAAGLPILPVVDPRGDITFRQILLGCLTLLPVGMLPTMMGVSGTLYFVAALVCGLLFLAFGVLLVIGKTKAHARALFIVSLVYLPGIFAFMLLDQI